MIQSLIKAVIPVCITASFAAGSLTDQIPKGYMLCPSVEKLVKDPKHKTWQTKDWRSYSESFSIHLDSFLGAQWEGVNVGSINCIYGSNEKMSLPVILTYKNLAYSPHGGKWTQNGKGRIICKSPNQTDCAFLPKIPKKTSNIYDEIRNLKKDSSTESGF